MLRDKLLLIERAVTRTLGGKSHSTSDNQASSRKLTTAPILDHNGKQVHESTLTRWPSG